MKGAEINALCKLMAAFDQTYIPMTNELKVINKEHTMICAVERLNHGAPLFDVIDDRYIEAKAVKLSAKEDYEISTTENALYFKNDTSAYRFKVGVVPSGFEIVKEYSINPALIVTGVSAKELLAAVKEAKKFRDWVKLTAHDGKLTISTEYYNGEIEYRKEIGFAYNEVDFERMNEAYTSMFAVNYLIKVLSCAPAKTKLVIAIDNDYPIKIAWNTSEYRYGVIIAPRVESKD